jgi:MFS family permease
MTHPSATDIARQDRRRVIWLSLAQLISWGTLFYTFALLMEPVERELGLSRTASSLAFSLALLVEGLLGYPVGRLIDRGHGRVIMAAGSVLAALGFMALSYAGSPLAFYLCWLLLGVGMSGVLYTPVFAIVTRRYPQDFRRAIITLTFLGGLASTVFIPLGAALIGGLGWRMAVQVLAALHLLVCLPIHLLWLRGEAASPARMARSAASHAPLRNPAFWLVAAFVVLILGVTAALPAHMVSMLREQGLASAWVIAVPALIGALQVFGRVLMFFFEHRFDVHKSNRIIMGLIPAGLLVLLVGTWHSGEGLVGPLLFAALFGMGNGMSTIVKGTAIALYVSREQVATLNGLIAMPSALARAAAPLLIGAMWSPAGGYRSGVLVLLVASCVALVCLVLAQRLSAARMR